MIFISFLDALIWEGTEKITGVSFNSIATHPPRGAVDCVKRHRTTQDVKEATNHEWHRAA